MSERRYIVRVDLHNGDIAYIGNFGLTFDKAEAIAYADKATADYVAEYANEQGMYSGATCSVEHGPNKPSQRW